jgi:hypothetical protein
MCKRLHDCDLLAQQETRELICALGWSSYGVLQAVLDFCFKQKSGKLTNELSVLSSLVGVESDLLSKTINFCLEKGLLSTDGKSIWNEETLEDKLRHSERKQVFKARSSKAAKAKHQAGKKSLLVAEPKHLLGEEEEEEEKEEEKKDLKEGGLEGESEVGVPAKQVRSRKPNYHPDSADELPLPASLDTFEVRQALTLWLDHRAKLGKKYRSPYWLSTLAENWDGNPDGLIEALKFSAGAGYQGIFPPNNSNQHAKQTVMGTSKRENETLALIEEMRKRDQESLIVEVR